MTREDLIEGIVKKLVYGVPDSVIKREKGISVHPSGAAKLRREIHTVKHYARRGSPAIVKTERSIKPSTAKHWADLKRKYGSKAQDVMVLHGRSYGKRTKKLWSEY